ncbi:MAG: glycoside hydrolase family 99-like domain-containing protein, partial [Novosphingobium sp.]|nr:glycoside hydrolase family 99-like domain-containing protein [Novosphingobium sp.]
DSGVEFPPHNMKAANLAPGISFQETYSGYCPDYYEIAEMYLANTYGPQKSVFRGVFPSWDNTARRGAIGSIIQNGTPENYERWLSMAVAKTRDEFPGQNRLVFINAWNEWAEGCHLEPCRKHGHAFLEATARARTGQPSPSWPHTGVPPESQRLGRSKGNYRQPASQKGLASRAFRAVRDTLSGRRSRNR